MTRNRISTSPYRPSSSGRGAMRPDYALWAVGLCLGLIVAPGLASAQSGTGGQDDVGGQDGVEGQGGVGGEPGDQPIPPAAPPLLTLNQDRLFKDSAWGRAVLNRAESDGAALAAENRRIEVALEQEERSLTERRATMNAADFAALTSAFDIKVEEIRAAQEGKARSIQRRVEDDRRQFFEAATPILGDVLADSGASAILSDSAIVMSLSALDITNIAIARIDIALPPPPASEDAPLQEAPAETPTPPPSTP